jgi:hypothetical protein
MLFPYKFIDHNINHLQVWINFLFINVWCNADPKTEYSFDLFERCPELKKVIIEEEYKEDPTVRGNDYITGPIRGIYEEFQKLKPIERKQIKKWYKRSLDIEKICDNEKLFNPISRYILEKYSKSLSDKLYKFYVDLFEKGLDLAVIRNQNGNLKDHYDEFVKINSRGICPFCGIDTIRSYEMMGHEAYDHFLPKEKYPLYAINFKNLVPTCHDCNSTYKTRDIPIVSKNKKNKRRAFFPYTGNKIEFKLKINVNITDYKFYKHSNINIDFLAASEKEKIKTWKETYSIESRYKDYLTNESRGKYWLVNYMDEMSAALRNVELIDLPNRLEKNPFRGDNFLKVPFLLACDDIGLFD